MTDIRIELPQYQCHKVVRAAKITQVTTHDSGGTWLLFGELRTDSVFPGEVVDAAWVSKHKPDVGGYFVVYDDGYESYSPAGAFEGGYTRAGAHMDFGAALKALKNGQRVARAGWNGKGMWLVLIHAGNAMHTSAAGSFDMQDCVGMKTATGVMQPGWLASQADMLAEDWVEVA